MQCHQYVVSIQAFCIPFYTYGFTDDIEVWEDEDVEDDIEDLTAPYENTVTPHPLVMWFVSFFVLIQKIHYIPKAAMSAVVHFLFIFFNVLSRLCPQISDVFALFPSTVYRMDKLLGMNTETFTRYVTCEKCYSVYTYTDCIEVRGTLQTPKLCSHKNSRQGRVCNGQLLKGVQLSNGKKIFYPLKVYCYTPLLHYLKIILNRPGLCDLCNKWKNVATKKGVYRDVYDGKVWNRFKVYNGEPFLSSVYTYGLMLNIDWFQPCKHTQYSVGAIYLTIMNLPREIRFKQENVILVGLIPGPREPKHDINALLLPLVQELLRLWDGVEMEVLGNSVLVRCALLCVSCDIPASRKVSGFLGHSAELGCSKCYKKFYGFLGQRNYSGFDRSQWVMRTAQEHRRNVSEIEKCTTLTKRNELESKYGCRYSVLLDLPYFDPIAMTVIDPMHNLYLGTAKRLITVWLDKGLITRSDLLVIQNLINSVEVPRYVGRIPHKILSSFSGFTADQFKNWTNLYSLLALRDILPDEHYKCWRYFVQASRILCEVQITEEDIKLADAFLLQFCHNAEVLYGQDFITPNMHLHCHLKEVLYDYGPTCNFWLFSYERYNGILEQYPSNNRSFEIVMMKRFYKEFGLYSCGLPEEFQSDFSEIFMETMNPVLVGSLKTTIRGKVINRIHPQEVVNWSCLDCFSLPKSYIRSTLSSSSLQELNKVYSRLYPRRNQTSIGINSVYRKYQSVIYNGLNFNSKNNSIVYVTDPSTLEARPVKINHFMMHSLHYEDAHHQHIFAVVSWLKNHPHKSYFGKPLEIWWKDLFEFNLDIFVPIQLLICHSASSSIKFEDETVFLLCPIQRIPVLHTL